MRIPYLGASSGIRLSHEPDVLAPTVYKARGRTEIIVIVDRVIVDRVIIHRVIVDRVIVDRVVVGGGIRAI